MTTPLGREIKAIVETRSFDAQTTPRFMSRLDAGKLVRAEKPASHFCTYFLPFNATHKTVFLVSHKKSGLWLTPGGHIEPGESLIHSVNREIREELGVRGYFTVLPKPFLLTIVDIQSNQVRPCRRHYDIWFLMPSDWQNFQVDPKEFHETRWVNKAVALQLLTDATNIQGVNAIL